MLHFLANTTGKNLIRETLGAFTAGTHIVGSLNFCAAFPHALSAPAIWLALVLVTWSLLGRGMRMSVCVWRP